MLLLIVICIMLGLWLWKKEPQEKKIFGQGSSMDEKQYIKDDNFENVIREENIIEDNAQQVDHSYNIDEILKL